MLVYTMNYIDILRDSIETSLCMKLFKTKQDSMEAHLFQSTLEKVPMILFENVENFDPIRLQDCALKAYPVLNRPRGKKDISSVRFYQQELKHHDLPPIWMIHTKDRYILLDGVHRVVASHIERKKYIYAYVIQYT